MNSSCIDSIISSIIHSVVNTLPKTISECEKQRTIYHPKHFYSVTSDSNKDISYKITYSPNFNMYRCECKAWEYCWYDVNQEQNQRTCKHIIAIRMWSKIESPKIKLNCCINRQRKNLKRKCYC